MTHIPGPRRIWKYLAGSAVRIVLFPVRVAITRYARAAPGPEETAGANRRVFILLANAWSMGGTIRTVHNLAGHLAQAYDVEILSVIRRRERPFFEFPAGVRVTTLRDLRPGAADSRPGLLPRLLERCPSVLMHPADSRADQFNLRVDLDLARKLRGRAGFLIGTRPGHNLLAAELALPGLATIGQEHMHLSAHPRAMMGALRRSYPKLDALAVLTESDAQDYERLLGTGRPRVVRLPNAARDLGPGRADLEATTVLAAGRLNRQKGFDLLLRAFARIAPDHPEWRLRICGQGGDREELARLAAREGLAGIAELPGPRDLGEEMAQASIFVLSSRSEGFPLVLLEAMSMGMAVVSFDCPTGPRDIVENERNGLLVPARDVEALADAVARMMEDGELRRRCAAAALETVQEYTVDAVGRRWEALLDEVAAERNRRLAAEPPR